MTAKQKINLFLGNLISKVNPHLAVRIQDKRAFERYQSSNGDMDWKLKGYGNRMLYSAAGMRVGNNVLIGGGYRSWELEVSNQISIYDLESNQWLRDIEIPVDAAQTHQAIACESDRYLYWLGGQLGPRVHPCIATCYILDLETCEWTRFIDFPRPMYGSTAQFYDGKIHVIGGAEADRKSTATIHWSMPVKDGKPLADSWADEPETPLEGTHRGSVILDDYLYLPGGQIGETPPKNGNPDVYDAKFGMEDVFPEVARYSFKTKTWELIAPLPIQVSHNDCTVVTHNGKVLVVGGMELQDPDTHEIFLTDAIQEYDPATNTWSKRGSLVYRVKSMVCAVFQGSLYVFGGQKDTSAEDPRPGRFTSNVWCAPLD